MFSVLFDFRQENKTVLFTYTIYRDGGRPYNLIKMQNDKNIDVGNDGLALQDGLIFSLGKFTWFLEVSCNSRWYVLKSQQSKNRHSRIYFDKLATFLFPKDSRQGFREDAANVVLGRCGTDKVKLLCMKRIIQKENKTEMEGSAGDCQNCRVKLVTMRPKIWNIGISNCNKP